MKYLKLLSVFTVLVAFAGSASAQTVVITWNASSEGVSPGNLFLPVSSVLTDSDDWSASDLDELSSPSTGQFQIQGLSSGTLNVTMNALVDDINITGTGLQDGGSGFNAVGEGITFTFDLPVTIDTLDFSSFSSVDDDFEFLNDGVTFLTIQGDLVNGNSVSLSEQSIAVGDEFTMRIPTGGGTSGFILESMTISVSAIPEPSTCAAIGGILVLGIVLYRRRKQTAATVDKT